MPVTLEQFGIDRLAAEERVELLGLIWDSLADGGAATPVPDWHWDILRERMAEARADPAAGIPWEVLREQLLGPR